MNKQRQIINEMALDFKRDNMTTEDFLHIKTNNIVFSIISEFKKYNYSKIVIENFNNNFDNLVLANLAGAAAQILEVPLLLIGKKKKNIKNVKRNFPHIDYLRKNRYSKNECFYLSPKSAYDSFGNFNCDCKYTRIDYYPLLGMLPLDLFLIAQEYYEADINYLEKESARLLKQGISFSILSNSLMGQYQNGLNNYRAINSPLKYNKNNETIIVFPNCNIEKAIESINHNYNANVIYLIDNSIDEDSEFNKFYQQIYKVQNTPLELFNIFNINETEEFLDCLFENCYLVKGEGYEDIVDILKKNNKIYFI